MTELLRDLSELLQTNFAQGSLLAVGAAFLFGVFVGFTPCVYPILPLTVAYIGKASGGKRWAGFFYSLAYVFGMAVVYSAVALLTGRLGGLWNNGWMLFAIANFFILLALWQLGVIRVPMPAFLSGPKSRRGGILGALGVGAASGLIVAPCLVPGLAAVIALTQASGSRLLFHIAVMFAYSLGLGSLVVICGTFSGVLASLPRSGRWLGVIEKVFAALIFLVAEYFLIQLGRNTDFMNLSVGVNIGGK